MKKSNKLAATVIELLKWGLIVFLVFPIFQRNLPNNYDLPRVMLGILLLVLYIGKMFYDMMLEKQGEAEKPLWLELLRLLGVIILIAIIIAAAMLVIGLYVFYSMQDKVNV